MIKQNINDFFFIDKKMHIIINPFSLNI